MNILTASQLSWTFRKITSHGFVMEANSKKASTKEKMLPIKNID
jgi:hypothetical protein